MWLSIKRNNDNHHHWKSIPKYVARKSWWFVREKVPENVETSEVFKARCKAENVRDWQDNKQEQTWEKLPNKLLMQQFWRIQGLRKREMKWHKNTRGLRKCGIYWQKWSDSDLSSGNTLKETPWMSESDWGQYVSWDEPEHCCFGMSKDLEKGHGTAKISNGSLRSLVVA